MDIVPADQNLEPPSSDSYTLEKSVPPEVTVTPPLPRERDHLVYSILTTLLCCPPIGIAALVYSTKTKKANLQGAIYKAHHASARALTLNRVALGIGTVIFLTVVLYLIFGILTKWNYYKDPHTYDFYNG